MRNTKLWSVLLAAVLLCASVVGVLFIGAQADEVMYTWNVTGTTDVSSEDKNAWTFATVQEAVQKAYAIRDQWTANDALTIALGSNQTITAGVNSSADDQRKIFNVNSIFRAAGDFLPITIDGGAETKYALDFNITDVKTDAEGKTTPNAKEVNCTNEYTFKNLSLPWGDDPVTFYAGCAQVTFDTCTVSGGTKLHLSSGAGTVLAFGGIGQANWDAMKQPGLDGKDVLVSKLTFINTDVSSLGNWHVHNQYNVVAFSTKNTFGGTLDIKPENVQSVIEVGNGGKVARTNMITGGANVVPTFGVEDDPATEANEAKARTAYNELVFRTLDGADMRGLFGVYSIGESDTARKAPHANFTFDFQGGSNTTSAVICVAQQHLDVVGNLHVILGENFTTNAPNLFEVLQVNYNATLDGDVVVDINGNSLAKPIAGPRGGELKGDMTVNINSGDITNYALNDGIANGASIAGKISGTLTTNVYDGNITNFAAIGDTKVASVGKIVNNFYGGRIGAEDGKTGTCYGGSDTIGLTCDIENNYLGTTFTKSIDGVGGTFGGSKQNSVNGTITNYYGEKDGANPVHITVNAGISGGNQLSGGTVTKVINHFENATFNCTNYASGRTNGGTVIENYFYDGFKHTANTFYCGTNNASTAHTIYNYFLGGESTAKSEILCGSASGSPADIYNYFLGGTFEGVIYGGTKTGKVSGAVNNNFGIDKDGTIGGDCSVATFFGGSSDAATIDTINNNYYAGTLGTKGTGTTAAAGLIFGGSKKGTVTTINNKYCGAEFLAYTYSGGDTNAVTDINNEVDVFNEVGFFGGNRAGTATNVTTVVGVENDIEDDVVTAAFYGGSRGGPVTGTIKTTLNGGTYGGFYGTGSVAAKNGTVINTLKDVTLTARFCGNAANANVTSTSVTTTLEGVITMNAAVEADGNGGCPEATLTVKAGTKLNMRNSGSIAPTTVEENVTLTQTEYWRDSHVYFTGDTTNVTATDEVTGMIIVTDDAITGTSGLTKKSANLILSDRVALRVVFDKPVASFIEESFLSAHVNTKVNDKVISKTVKIEIDPKNECAVIVYGIGLTDFSGQITFAGKLPALDESQDTIIELSDSAVGVIENDTIYKAIADFGRVFLGETAVYNLEPAEVTNVTQEPTINTFVVTGKNLVMSDALGIRYYATLDGETKIEDIKVFVGGVDRTNLCEITGVIDAESGITSVTIDAYLYLGTMSTAMEVEILFGEDVVLDYVEYIDAVAQKIIDVQGNELAKAALVFIQAASVL